MKANLHMHSRFSDGSSTPEEMAQAAARAGVRLAALSDHDSMGGCARFAAACAACGIQSIPACEIDVSDSLLQYKSEILGYFPASGSSIVVSGASGEGSAPADPRGPACTATAAAIASQAAARARDAAPRTRDMLARAMNARRERIAHLLAGARTLCMRPDFSVEDFERTKRAALGAYGSDAELSWSRVDFFLYLQEKQVIDQGMTYKKFKKEWMESARFPLPALEKPRVAQAAALIHADGGFAVLPHPGHIWDDDPGLMTKNRTAVLLALRNFRASGIDGVELYWYGSNKRSEQINSIVKEAASSIGLFCTYGSDCHGPGSGAYTIELFSGDFAGFPAPTGG